MHGELHHYQRHRGGCVSCACRVRCACVARALRVLRLHSACGRASLSAAADAWCHAARRRAFVRISGLLGTGMLHSSPDSFYTARLSTLYRKAATGGECLALHFIHSSFQYILGMRDPINKGVGPESERSGVRFPNWS
jgi:hypothetical protein